MTKQDLTAAIEIQKKLTRFENRLFDLEATGGIRTSLQSAGGRSGAHGNAAVIAGELASEVSQLRKQLEIEQTILRRALDKTELDETERKLMLLRYVECRGWKEVAARMAYSIPQTYRLHAAILERMGIKDDSL